MKHTFEKLRWLSAIEKVQVDGEHMARTGDVETLLVVLSGTFDMLAGSGSWPARGVRTSPFAGKPVALFLPPNTKFALENGTGEVLLVSGHQPEQEEEIGEASHKKPLLAMAGSGKAFDPKTGEWKLQEAFPSSPQALLPRHVEETELDAATVRWVFPADYKALCLSLCEILVPAGKTVPLPKCDLPDYPTEMALYYDAPGGLEIDGETLHARGTREIDPTHHLTAGTEDAFVSLAYAGPKLT